MDEEAIKREVTKRVNDIKGSALPVKVGLYNGAIVFGKRELKGLSDMLESAFKGFREQIEKEYYEKISGLIQSTSEWKTWGGSLRGPDNKTEKALKEAAKGRSQALAKLDKEEEDIYEAVARIPNRGGVTALLDGIITAKVKSEWYGEPYNVDVISEIVKGVEEREKQVKKSSIKRR